ncbi:phage baseplate assembly protein V [Phytohabitans houttuyneae]|uniref:Gp5/Type VI secretion system Vgr protein OB-fold domain-containing protein n=1 Tax=Phytohabitans houttuyneae TaxID=1076126 RepID=A0A6V8KLR3_9ACTN|nr:phage baseplate assembly protein V [Phytohabitans houttuyneae]GFJ83458.1 hypothetical protein Phou_076380 [Phytohabitans houttuyneae]
MSVQTEGTALTAAVPSVEVRVDGRALPAEAARRLAEVRVTARLSQPAQCELSYVTWSGADAETALFKLGAALSVQAYTDTDPMFAGDVTAFEVLYAADGTATLRVRAYDLLYRLRRRRRTQVFESMTAAKLARALTGKAVSAERDGPLLERIVHHHRHDLELLVDVANRAGLHPVTDGDGVRLVGLDGYGEPVPLRLGVSLLEVAVEANLDGAVERVRALGWHPQRAQLIDQRATTAHTGRRIELRPDPSAVGTEAERLLVDRAGRGDAEVQAAAQVELDTGTAAAVSVSGVAGGSALLRPGARVRLSGIAPALAGTYVLTEVTHTVDATGYLTRFGTRPPRPAVPRRTAALTLGTVTAVDDPDGYGRVKVRLPALGDLDAGWLGVLCPGAGPDRGLVALPDVDDTVLVALPHGEPAAGIVLGGLYGAVEPPDPGIDGGRVRRWSMRTAGGQSLLVDDAEQSLILRNKAGSRVELGDGEVRLHAAGDLVIQAPGRGITIRAATVDFVHAPVPEDGGL